MNIITKLFGEKEDITKEFLNKKRTELGREGYEKLLKRLKAKLVAKIISRAEKGLERDRTLEENIALIDEEKNKI